MTKERLAEIERYCAANWYSIGGTTVIRELLVALKASNERVAKLREALLLMVTTRGEWDCALSAAKDVLAETADAE